jgi:hypothetical protein
MLLASKMVDRQDHLLVRLSRAWVTMFDSAVVDQCGEPAAVEVDQGGVVPNAADPRWRRSDSVGSG